MNLDINKKIQQIKKNAENIANKKFNMSGEIKLDIVFIVQEIKSFDDSKQVEKINVTANFINDLDAHEMEYDAFFTGKEIQIAHETIYKHALTDTDFKKDALENLNDSIKCSTDFVTMYKKLLFNKNGTYRISCKKYIQNK